MTYPASLLLPARRTEGLLPACLTDARLALGAAMVALAGALLLL